MLVKVVETIAATDTAGQTVESVPVRVAGDSEVNSAGSPITITDVTEDDLGLLVRIVDGTVTTNSIGQSVDSRPVTGISVAGTMDFSKANNSGLLALLEDI